MAQLPVLIYDQKPPMSSEEFKTLAQPLISNSDLKILNKLTIDPDPHQATTAYEKTLPSAGCDFIEMV